MPQYRLDLPVSWLVLVTGSIFSTAMMLYFPDDTSIKIMAMCLFWLASVASVRFDISHPFVWFGGSFLLYSISGPMLIEMRLHPTPMWGGVSIQELDFSYAMDLQYLGLLVCSFVIGPDRVDLSAALRDIRRSKFFVGVTPVLVAALIVATIGVSEIVSQGFTRKIDVILYGSWATRLGFGFNIATTCAGVLLVKQFTENARLGGYATIACFLALGLLIVLVTGQRNILFRIILVVLFTFHIANNKISFRVFVLLGLLVSPLILILGDFKMAALWGSGSINLEMIAGYGQLIGHPELAFDSPLVRFAKLAAVMIMGSEFMTAGNNIAMLVWRVPHDIPFQNGWTLMNDVVEALQPGFLVLFDSVNTTHTYNRLFFPVASAEGSGQGFSLVGTGYFNFGVTGVIAVMAVFGGSIRAIYHWASKSAFGLFFFLGYLPVAISATRGDISAPISQGLKHVLLPLVAMLILSSPYFSRRND